MDVFSLPNTLPLPVGVQAPLLGGCPAYDGAIFSGWYIYERCDGKAGSYVGYHDRRTMQTDVREGERKKKTESSKRPQRKRLGGCIRLIRNVFMVLDSMTRDGRSFLISFPLLLIVTNEPHQNTFQERGHRQL